MLVVNKKGSQCWTSLYNVQIGFRMAILIIIKMNQEQLQEKAESLKGEEVKVDLTNGDQLQGN